MNIKDNKGLQRYIRVYKDLGLGVLAQAASSRHGRLFYQARARRQRVGSAFLGFRV